MRQNNLKAWLYLLPAILFLGVFMVYPLLDVLVYSVEEGYNSASQTSFGTGMYNYSYVLHDPYFLQAIKNTFIIVIITVPLSTGLALLIALGLNSIKKLKELFVTDKDRLANYSKILYAQARLVSGLSLTNASEISDLVVGLMTE